MLSATRVASLCPPLLSISHGGPAAAAPSFWDTLLHSNAFNVALVAVVLGWVWYKFDLGGQLARGHQKMLDELASSRQLRESAEMRLSESRARLNGLTQAVQDVLADADQMAAHLAQQAMARANMDTERLLAATRHRLQQEEDALSRHLQASLIQDVVQQARALLAEQLTAEDQAKTVTQFMDALPALQKSAASPQTNGSRLPVLSGADAGGPASDPVNAGTAVGRGG